MQLNQHLCHAGSAVNNAKIKNLGGGVVYRQCSKYKFVLFGRFGS